jgi:branched-chain amino acid transport system substrate-binding protein
MPMTRRTVAIVAGVAWLGGWVAALSPAGAADAIKIGMIAPLTGPGAFSGQLQSNGAKLAVAEVNNAGGVLGRPIELVIEDDQTTNPGAVLAFSKLAGDPDIPAFLGPIRSTQVHAIAGHVWRHRSSAHAYGQPVVVSVPAQ